MKTKMGVSAGVAALAALMVVGCQQDGSSGSSATAKTATEVHVDVTENGFEPAEVTVPAGQAVTLVMTRKTDQTCATNVEFEALKKTYDLPLGKPVKISLPPSQKGTLSYQCGMHMLGGKVVVR